MKNKIVLAFEKCSSRNYSTMSSKTADRLEVKKYCQTCNAHTVHKETK